MEPSLRDLGLLILIALILAVYFIWEHASSVKRKKSYRPPTPTEPPNVPATPPPGRRPAPRIHVSDWLRRDGKLVPADTTEDRTDRLWVELLRTMEATGIDLDRLIQVAREFIRGIRECPMVLVLRSAEQHPRDLRGPGDARLYAIRILNTYMSDIVQGSTESRLIILEPGQEGWPRPELILSEPETVFGFLDLIDVGVTVETIATWSEDERLAVVEWARATWLEKRYPGQVEIPPVPEVLDREIEEVWG